MSTLTSPQRDDSGFSFVNPIRSLIARVASGLRGRHLVVLDTIGIVLAAFLAIAFRNIASVAAGIPEYGDLRLPKPAPRQKAARTYQLLTSGSDACGAETFRIVFNGRAGLPMC